MEPNPYEVPAEEGYSPPTRPLLTVHQSALLFAAAYTGIILLAAPAFLYLPEQMFGVSLVWLVCIIESALMVMLWLLLMIGRAAGLVEAPKPRSRP